VLLTRSALAKWQQLHSTARRCDPGETAEDKTIDVAQLERTVMMGNKIWLEAAGSGQYGRLETIRNVQSPKTRRALSSNNVFFCAEVSGIASTNATASPCLSNGKSVA
jgi:hypothetical protein